MLKIEAEADIDDDVGSDAEAESVERRAVEESQLLMRWRECEIKRA